MQGVTLSIAILVSLGVLFLKPARALAVYFILLMAYPSFLVVQVGTLDISAARIAGTALLLRCLFNSEMTRKFKWCGMDTWIVVGMIVSFVIPLAAWKMPQMRVFENRSGFLLSTFLAYFLARFCVDDYRSMKTVARWVAPVVTALAILGVIEATYGIQPFFALRRFCPWRSGGMYLQTNVRSGFYRAVGPASHSILFGAAFAMFLPMIWSLRHEAPPWKTWARVIAVAATVGALSSMSSGPWMMVILLWGFLMLEHAKYLVKPLLWLAVAGCIVVDFLSNRTFYHVIVSYANPIGGTGWHRAKLIDLAIEHFGEWWLAGYGGQDPGWGTRLGMTWTDLTNHYIHSGVLYGIGGVVAVLGVTITAIVLLARAHRNCKDPIFRSWCWAFGSLIAMLLISFNACSFFDQTHAYFYGMLGMIASMVQGQPALEKARQRLRMARLARVTARPRDPVVV